jgi:beta-mannosidase
MKQNRTLLLDGKWKYLTDQNTSLSYDKAAELYSKNKISGKINVPSNWQLEGLNNYSGSVWFFKEFKLTPSMSPLHILEFSGVDYFIDVWLNDDFVGHHEGYFQKFFFDVTSHLVNKNNVLIVKVTSPFEEPGTVWPLKKKLIKGIFNHHDCRPGGWSPEYGQDRNTGGIWNDVKIISAGPVYFYNIKVSSKLENNYSTATLDLNLNYYSNNVNENSNEKLKIKIFSSSGKKISKEYLVRYKSGNNSLNFSFEINKPDLWWTWDTGEQNLYTLEISGKEFQLKEVFGIREVKSDASKAFYLNGKRLFLRGTNIIPTQFLSDLTEDKIRSQIWLVKDANVNIIRMHAHVNRKEYYDHCDEEGILVWQDFALQWTYDESPGFIRNAVKQIEDMVLLLYNHPSIAFWCCHNEPGKQIESLDPELLKAVEGNDNSRIIRIASNYEEHPYDGWYWGNKEHFAACPMGPLVTEFGAQALPDLQSLRKFLTAKEVSKPDWKKWKYHNFQYEQTFHIAEIDKGKDIKQFISNSQDYQAELITTAIDFYRREKFNKVTALFHFMFIDCWESITWSVVDYYGKKKKGYFALKRAFQPLYVSVKLMRKKYFAGQKLNVNFWIINDLLNDYNDCRIDFILDLKVIGSLQVPRIDQDSVTQYHWENLEIFLPGNISPGKYDVVLFLRNNDNKVISANVFSVEIDKKIKMNDE